MNMKLRGCYWVICAEDWLCVSPLCILSLHVAEACNGAAQLFPHGTSVSHIQSLVYQNHRRQHLYRNQQFRVREWTLINQMHTLVRITELDLILSTCARVRACSDLWALLLQAEEFSLVQLSGSGVDGWELSVWIHQLVHRFLRNTFPDGRIYPL